MASQLQNITKKKEKAARLLAEDVLSDERIAEECEVSRQTLARWKLEPVFSERFAAISKAYADRAMEHGLARREKRLTELDDIYYKLKQVIQERGEWEEMADVPGGTTGLVCKTYKGIGDNLQPVYEIDNSTIREIRAIHEQFAEELGQKVTKSQMSVMLDVSMAEEMRKARTRAEKIKST